MSAFTVAKYFNNNNMERDGNFLIFENDDEFADFVFEPIAHVRDGYYETGTHSHEYLEYVKEGVIFVIKGDNSAVCRRGCVLKRLPLVTEDGIPMNRTVPGQLSVVNVIDFDEYHFLRKNKRTDNEA